MKDNHQARKSALTRLKLLWSFFLDTYLWINTGQIHQQDQPHFCHLIMATGMPWLPICNRSMSVRLNPHPQPRIIMNCEKPAKNCVTWWSSLPVWSRKKEIWSLLKNIRPLQDNPGDFQNLEVHARAMKEFSQQMLKNKQASSKTMIAIDVLAENLEHHKMKVHDMFSALYRVFRSKKTAPV